MKNEKILNAMGKISDELVEDATIDIKKTKHTRVWIRWVSIAACLALVFAIGIPMLFPQTQIPISDNSAGVTVRYTKFPISVESANSLVYLTEEELFTEFDTAIFKGTITSVENIVLDFNGSKNYRAIAEIQVEKVYRGDCQIGATATVLLPCPVATNFWVSDTETVSKMEVGVSGIFMPMVYNEDSMRQENGATLMLKDIADYGFADGIRYAFLETSNGLVFSKSAYESIASATTLEEIEEYVIKMIEKTS